MFPINFLWPAFFTGHQTNETASQINTYAMCVYVLQHYIDDLCGFLRDILLLWPDEVRLSSVNTLHLYVTPETIFSKIIVILVVRCGCDAHSEKIRPTLLAIKLKVF